MTSYSVGYVQSVGVTLEAERESCREEDRVLTEGKKRFARRLYALRQKWSLLYPGASDRQFIEWYLRPAKYTGSFQSALDCGLAQTRGFTDSDWRYGEVAAAGGALRDNVAPEEIRQRRTEGLSIRPNKNTVTTIQIPSALAPDIRAARDAVSHSDNINGPESVARIIESYAAQQPALRDALRDTSATGRTLTAALVAQPRPDYRSELKKHGRCLICGVSPVELHHIRTDHDERSRSNERVVPLCARHHGARPGDDTDSIHARPLESYRDDAAFWRAAFEAVSDAAEATRPAQED